MQAFFGEPLLSHARRKSPRRPRSGSPTRSNRAARSPADGDVAIVSHGGVGTLLLCQLKGTAIHRAEDQPGHGHWFAFDRDTRRVCTAGGAL